MDPNKIAGRGYMRSANGGILVGGMVVAVGLVLLLENLGVLRSFDIWKFWPVFLIVIGALRILDSQRPASLVWGGLLATAGVLILLDNFNIVVFDLRIVWPIAVIAFGLSMLLRALDRQQELGTPGGTPQSNPTVSLYGVFSGGRRRIDSQEFRGGEVFALFGGFHLDLRGAQIPSGTATMELNSIFGGTEIIVPETWRVTMKGIGIFGGFEDKTIPPHPQPGVPTPELIITGSSVFGGATIRNKSDR